MRIVDLFNALPDIVVILILSCLLMSYGVRGQADRIVMLILFLGSFRMDLYS